MYLKIILKISIVSILLMSCKKTIINKPDEIVDELKIRQLADTIGFAQYEWQMDSIISRLNFDDKKTTKEIYKAVICPHDDYTYAAGLFNKTLKGIKAKTIVLIGVAHKAKKFNLENKLVFGSFNEWKSAYNTLKVSPLRDKLLEKMTQKTYIVHDSMMQLEHSLEAINPFLQNNNPEVEIIPLLVPYFTFENMEVFSEELSKALYALMKEENLSFGKDIAIVISNDAIHYGNEGWGSANLAPFGVDDLGIEKVKQKELTIINECLVDELNLEKIKNFNHYTVKADNFKEYQWTWCGRYSVPFGLLCANKLNKLIENKSLTGILIDYRSSYHNAHIKVKDLGMGQTAPANQNHWVGYVGVEYK